MKGGNFEKGGGEREGNVTKAACLSRAGKEEWLRVSVFGDNDVGAVKGILVCANWLIGCGKSGFMLWEFP